jgi:sorbitol-specific phosphotransferase system component IIBC
MSNQTTPVVDPEKPEPETVTDVPGGPLVGLKDILAASAGVMSRRIGVARSSAVAIAAVDALVRNIFPFIAFCEVLLVYNLLWSRGVPCV